MTDYTISPARYMTTSHAHGPWWVSDHGVRNSGGHICETKKALRYPGQEERYNLEFAERAANARLIAAAPTLLAALLTIDARLTFCATIPSFCIDAYDTYHQDIVRAAIAKATGGAS